VETSGCESGDEAGDEPGGRPGTHRWQDWSLEALLAAKAATGHRVSVVVPSRDEAATVGDVVARVRRDLVDAVPLVDELVVIDSDSSDDTSEVAAAAGATVHRVRDIRPELGWRPGKGEAMWKSQFVTTGSLVVFMDADLVEWDTHFVTGLLGPLLTDPGVGLVKGFYERPLSGGGDVAPAAAYDGGRVTELVARPLIALHFPELAGLVQPLAGEWSVRRSVLAELAVPCGYAVEFAALVDTVRTHGASSIAQVDLGRRAHRHQSLRDLGAMATQILALAHARAGCQALRHPAGQVSLRQFPAVAGEPVPATREVDLAVRPPAWSVQEASACER